MNFGILHSCHCFLGPCEHVVSKITETRSVLSYFAGISGPPPSWLYQECCSLGFSRTLTVYSSFDCLYSRTHAYWGRRSFHFLRLFHLEREFHHLSVSIYCGWFLTTSHSPSSKTIILVSYGFCKLSIQNGWLKITDIYCLIILETRSLQSSCH